MMSMYFEEITQDTLYIALEIINSNPEYNQLENGNVTRTIDDMEKEFLNSQSTSVFIKLDDTYIGIIDYLLENPKDQTPWLGLLIIHRDYQGYGFGVQAYEIYENEMLDRGLKCIRIGVIKDNHKAHSFWESLGFKYFKKALWKKEIEISCYEKQLEQN
ncbi:GNAT family N-acetyltransferase [Bacillus salipaludis]|uniref:GNAT family N-acetyltransferase n=2 Tax=Bacillus salipaludis TaxID=2547811 RepID=A0A4R5VLX8_9BACI|nr:GNAT family N-acetyltransferase [Bacillus salipaludis]